MYSVDLSLLILVMSSFTASQTTTAVEVFIVSDGMLETDVTSFAPLTVGRLIYC